jgi:hypothetical protein
VEILKSVLIWSNFFRKDNGGLLFSERRIGKLSRRRATVVIGERSLGLLTARPPAQANTHVPQGGSRAQVARSRERVSQHR